MGGLKTLAVALFLLPAAGTQAQTNLSADGQLRFFATCAGRLSALVEHQWMFDGPASDRTEAARTQLLDIIGAILPAGREVEVLNWRIDAKSAHARLLYRAVFNEDPDDAAWAHRLAARQTAVCRSFLLS
ncbi:MAG: hypothetical protein QNJ44_22095 [Rhodobacter sp.]|nr:hypothetical protein [Rhodobacter sp.]